MSGLDITLLAIILFFGVVGFFTGFLQALGSIVGVLFGTYIATRLVDPVAAFLQPLLGGNALSATVVAFVLIFLVVSRLVGLVFHIVNQAFNILRIIPGLHFFNRILGFVLGLIEGALVIGVILTVLQKLPISPATVATLNDSGMTAALLRIGHWFVPLFPTAFEKAKALDGIVR